MSDVLEVDRGSPVPEAPAAAPGPVKCTQVGCEDEATVKPLLECQRTFKKGSRTHYWRKPVEVTVEEPLCLAHARGATLSDILTDARWKVILDLFPPTQKPMRHLTRMRLQPITSTSPVTTG